MQDIQINAKAEVCPHCHKPIKIVAEINGQQIEFDIKTKQQPKVTRPKNTGSKWRKKWSEDERRELLDLHYTKYNGVWTQARINGLARKLKRNAKSVQMQLWKLENNKLKFPKGNILISATTKLPLGLKKGTKLRLSTTARNKRRDRLKAINAIAKTYKAQGMDWQSAMKKAGREYKAGGRNTQA